MRKLQYVCALVTTGGFLSLATPAQTQAQTRYPYRPATPTISPWFGLNQFNPGPLSNYHYFVRPRIEMQDTIRRQNATIRRQSAGLTSLGQQVTRLETGVARPTGTGSVFMNYLHYYPGPAFPAQRRYRSGRR